MLAEVAENVVTVPEVMHAVEQVGRLVMMVLAIQVLMVVAWIFTHRRLAKNQVELARMVQDECCKGGG